MENPKLKLLIVDTDTKIIDFFVDTLDSYFDEILVEGNGELGFQSFSQNRPDLVIAASYLPLVSGLEMAKLIRNLQHSVRIILYSDTKDTGELIQAIENGIKGFLFTPLDEDYLIQLVSYQISKIKRVRQLNMVEERNILTEKEFDKSKRILQVISQSTTMFFSSGFNEETANKVLKLIGEVIDASRVYIYKNYHENKTEYTSRIYEWVADGIMPTIGNLSVTKKHIASSGLVNWAEVMKNQRGNITGFVRDFTLKEQQKLKNYNVKSLLAIPIYVNNLWLGFLGIDDCEKEKVWADSEISALESLAYNFGAAIQKKDMDDQLIQLNLGLEKRVKERTKELEFEIAERSMAEALLKDSEEKYRLIYENATDGILLLQAGKIVLVNPAMIDILEEIPRNLIGKNFSELIPEGRLDQVKKYFNNDQNNDLSEVFHLEVVLSNNKHKWLEFKPTRISWYGEPAHLVFISNITLRRQAENELRQLNETLEKRIDEEVRQVEQQQQLLVQKSKLESIGELSAGLAHEINQPLVSISMGLDNMLNMLTEDLTEQIYFRNKIQTLFNDIERIKNIIEHVRIFSRDQQNSRVDKVQVSLVIKDALSMISRQMREQSIEVIDENIDNNLIIEGNQYKLEQVFLNLISNAKYAVNEKYEGNSEYHKQLIISCIKHNDKAIISVRDNGIGIPEKVLPDIFNPFFTTKSETNGTGLGLSISYGIIKEMNGEIFAESKLDEFTEIKVHLPLISN